jgi:hypothetical protein
MRAATRGRMMTERMIRSTAFVLAVSSVRSKPRPVPSLFEEIIILV